MQQQRSNLVTLGSPQILLNSENKLGLSLLSTIPCYQLTLNAIALKMTSLNVPGRVDELLCEFYQLLDAS